MSVTVRVAVPGDGAALHAMTLALATSHGHEGDVTAVPDDFERALFGSAKISGALIAEIDGKPAGSALWHRSFSSFRGREVMFLEDLSVLPAFRRKGVGQALLKNLARLAVELDYPAIFWNMMSWNDGARALYEAAGAEVDEATCYCRLHGEALERLSR
jgi:GNAT superfamily N-acetyltransferase